MKVDEYKVMADCVETGIAYGYARAHKHTDTPSEEQMRQSLADAIMLQICDYFKFEEVDE